MSDKDAQQDPSMEEILASIRRIISEDEVEEGEDAEAEPAEAADAGDDAPEDAPEEEAAKGDDDAGESEDVLELTQMVQEDGSTVDLAEEAAAEPEPEPEPEPDMTEDDGALISEAVSVASIDAMAKLADAAEPEILASSGLSFKGSGHTVEDLVVEMIRPMLREWLDENLPATVGRIVQKEIRKLARQAEPE